MGITLRLVWHNGGLAVRVRLQPHKKIIDIITYRLLEWKSRQPKITRVENPAELITI